MKATEIEVKALFDLSHNIARELLAKLRYPYEAPPGLGARTAVVGLQLFSNEYEKRGEQVWIHKSAKVALSVSLTGSLIVCVNAEFRHRAYLRGNILIGTGSVAGNSCEFKNSSPLDSVEALHYSYVGDPTFGYHARMGAGSVTNNVKSDRKSIVIRIGDGAIETGLRKIGAILGDYVEVGCGTVLNPDFVVGKNTMIHPLASVRGPVPTSLIVKSAENIVIK